MFHLQSDRQSLHLLVPPVPQDRRPQRLPHGTSETVPLRSYLYISHMFDTAYLHYLNCSMAVVVVVLDDRVYRDSGLDHLGCWQFEHIFHLN